MQTGTSYLGLRLEHPFIAGASPLGYRVDAVKRLEDAGCAAVVLHSLFEEQITFEEEERIAGISPYDREFADVFAEFPKPDEYPMQPGQYAEHIHRLKKAVAIPVTQPSRIGVLAASPILSSSRTFSSSAFSGSAMTAVASSPA